MKRALAFAAFSAVAVSSCSGGGESLPGHSVAASQSPSATPSPAPPASATPSSQPSSTASPAATANVTFAITIPPSGALAARRLRYYVSPATHSVTISELGSGGAVVRLKSVALGAGVPGCQAQAAGTRCSFPVVATVGPAVAFSVASYASSNGTGAVLASATISLAVAADGSTATTIALDGVADHVALTPPRLVPIGTGAVQVYAISATEMDPSGAVIVGSDALAGPVSLSIAGDPTHALSLASYTIQNANAPMSLLFDPSKHLVAGQIGAVTASGNRATIDVEPLNTSVRELDGTIGGADVTASVSEAGFTASFAVSTIAQQNTGQLVPTGFSTAVSAAGAGSATVTVAPGMDQDSQYPGIVQLAISDGADVLAIPYYQTYAFVPERFEQISITNQSRGVYTDTSGHVWLFAQGNGAFAAAPVDLANGVTNGIDIDQPQGNIALGPDGNFWYDGIDAFGASHLCTFDVTARAQTCYDTGTFVPAGVFAGKLALLGTFGATRCGGALGVELYDVRAHSYAPCVPVATPNTLSLSEASSAVVDSGGNIWFPYFGSISSVNIANGVTNTYSSFNQIAHIALGPDGRVWFTDQAVNGNPGGIGNIDPGSGTITETTAPFGGRIGPGGFGFAPDGKLWFAAIVEPTNTAYSGYLGSFDPATGAIAYRVASGPANLRAFGMPGNTVAQTFAFSGKSLIVDGLGFNYSLVGVTLP